MTKQSEESSFFKSPKQLIIAVALAFIIPIGLAVMFSQLATTGRRGAEGANEEAVLQRIQPVARVELAAGGAAGGAVQTAEQIYNSVCSACHAAGVAGAPKVGDKAAWAPRIAQGFDKLVQSAVNGKNAMPPKGGAANLDENAVARVVAYMANKSGANFKEPAAPAATPAATASKAGEAAPSEPQSTASSQSTPSGTAAASTVAAATPATQPAPAAAPAAGAAGKGKTVYESTCVACHAAGVAGAPKVGDKAAWAPRIATGLDALTTSALKGKNAMPPKGGNTSLSDADVRAAVEYMVSQSK